ncbi:hypothetical protein [Sediminibacterium sp.]|uniref:hypothetical protein n=1 Tax=Sediminibacterium sp. TaxID=1917865 RepID=UPI003F69F8B5
MRRFRLLWFCLLLVCMGCGTRLFTYQSSETGNKTGSKITGEQFYQQAMTMQWKQRDSFAFAAVMTGNIPSFLRRAEAIHVSALDSATGKTNKATYFVMPDYLSIGTDDNWARIPLTPITAQRIADSFQCFLPTRKMVNDIHAAAKVKLAPMPMYIYRDSSITMWQHHLMIEGQRKGQEGLISGIKKDVVISDLLTRSAKQHRVAIYGWHQLNGKPIQPLYTGHVDWYADYSHGIRMIARRIKVNGQWMDYTDIMKHPVYRKLLSDEEFGDVFRY